MSTDDSRRVPRKSRKPAPRKNTKVTGERSEAAFLHRAAVLGFGIAKPWGDSRRYDLILDNGDCLHRVQVKCTDIHPRPRLRNPRHAGQALRHQLTLATANVAEFSRVKGLSWQDWAKA